MKRAFIWILVLALCGGLLAVAAIAQGEAAEPAPEYFRWENGIIVGSYTGSWVEIYINDLGAGAPISSDPTVSVSFRAEEPGEYLVKVYDYGALVYTQTIVVGAVPTVAPTFSPTAVPTAVPTAAPTVAPTFSPTAVPTVAPTVAPTFSPTAVPTVAPTFSPTAVPTVAPTAAPTAVPTAAPTAAPTPAPTEEPEPELAITLAADGKTAQITGDFTDLYVRAALVLDNNGVSGLYVAQASVSADGEVTIPSFSLPGLTVIGVNVTLVASVEDVVSQTPVPLAVDFMNF